jgi:hypothetical protein
MSSTKSFSKKDEPKRITKPLQVSEATEVTDATGMNTIFGLRKGTLYNLLAEVPELRDATISLARDGRQRGKRLFVVGEFRKFLNARRGV